LGEYYIASDKIWDRKRVQGYADGRRDEPVSGYILCRWLNAGIVFSIPRVRVVPDLNFWERKGFDPMKEVSVALRR